MSEDDTKPGVIAPRPLSPLRALWASLSLGQGVTIVGVVAVAAWLVLRLPAGTLEALAAKDPAELGASIAFFLLALGGVFTKARDGQ